MKVFRAILAGIAVLLLVYAVAIGAVAVTGMASFRDLGVFGTDETFAIASVAFFAVGLGAFVISWKDQGSTAGYSARKITVKCPVCSRRISQYASRCEYCASRIAPYVQACDFCDMAVRRPQRPCSSLTALEAAEKLDQIKNETCIEALRLIRTGSSGGSGKSG